MKVRFLALLLVLCLAMPIFAIAEDIEEVPSDFAAEDFPVFDDADFSESFEVDTELSEKYTGFTEEQLNEAYGVPAYRNESGKCNDSISWTLTNDGTMVVSGTGPMPKDWENVYANLTEEFPNYPIISSIIIQNGITSVSDYQFYHNSIFRTKNVTLGASVTSIGTNAFGVGSIENVQLSENLQTIGDLAFYNNPIKSITLPETLTTIGSGAFKDTYLTSVTIPASVANIGERAFGYDSHNDSVPGFKITGYCNSAAGNYAVANGITFVSLGGHVGQGKCSVCGASMDGGSVAPAPAPDNGGSVAPAPVPGPLSVTVNDIYPMSKLTIGVGEKYTPAYVPAGFKFKTSNKKIATVSASGAIKGKKTGSAKITVTAPDGSKKTIKVTVKKAASKVTLNKKKATMETGNTLQLKAKVTGTSYKRTWTSSKPSIATVDQNGKVTAISGGDTTITFKTFNGKKATCKIHIGWALEPE